MQLRGDVGGLDRNKVGSKRADLTPHKKETGKTVLKIKSPADGQNQAGKIGESDELGDPLGRKVPRGGEAGRPPLLSILVCREGGQRVFQRGRPNNRNTSCERSEPKEAPRFRPAPQLRSTKRRMTTKDGLEREQGGSRGFSARGRRSGFPRRVSSETQEEKEPSDRGGIGRPY